MLFNQSNINSIVQASQSDNLVIFIGAGFSKFSQSDTAEFPSWAELINEFKEELGTDENDFLKVAQLYELTFGKYKLYQKVKNTIPFHALPSDFHNEVFKLNPKYVLTTNWDDLLEKTVNQHNLNYDIVKSDIDLVKSARSKKLVKIHGSLDSHNIVFTEDDYLNYSINSPLIENYLKHILSTMTVLFLGYSFSDTDLKMITKWIEKQSSISPPRYLLHNVKDEAYNRYLINHGVSVISPKKSINFPELYTEFFKQIHSDPIVNKVISKGEKNSELDAIDFFYKKMKVLSDFNSLLPEQITDIFSNCTVEYHKGVFGLWFHNDTMTMDYDRDIRNIYRLFFSVVSETQKINEVSKDNTVNYKLNYIANTLLSANVIFIKFNNNVNVTDFIREEDISEKNKKITESFEKFIRFDSGMNPDLFLPIRIALDGDDKKEENLNAVKVSINNYICEYRKNQNYTKAMVYQFNYNFVIDRLILLVSDNKEEYISERVDWERDYLKGTYLITTKEKLNALVKALNFYWIYQFYFDANNDYKKFSGLAKSIKNGGFGFDNKEMRSSDRCVQLLRFYFTNDILIEEYSEFRKLMCLYIRSKVEIQSIEEKVHLEPYSIFILVKYFKFDELVSLIYDNILVKFRNTENEGNGDTLITISDDLKQYLLDTMSNLSEYIQQSKKSIYENVVTKSFVNILVAMALVNWNEEEWSFLVQTISQALKRVHIPYKCIKAIDNLILINYKLYKKDIPDLLKFFDIILYKIYDRRLSISNTRDVEYDLKYIYQYGSIIESKYSNIDLIDKVIDTFKIDLKGNKEYQRYQSKIILLPILPISNNKVAKSIKKYINKIRLKKWDDRVSSSYQEIITELEFIQYGFDVNDSYTEFLSQWVDIHYDSSVITDIEFSRVGGTEQLMGYFEFLGNTKDIEVFRELYKVLNTKYKTVSKVKKDV